MPTRNSMRRSGGTPALRSTMPFCTSMAQRTASTTLRNSTMAPSPVRLTNDYRVDQIAPKRPQPRQCPVLVGASEPAVSDHIRSQDCYELPGFDHGNPLRRWDNSIKPKSQPPGGLKMGILLKNRINRCVHRGSHSRRHGQGEHRRTAEQAAAADRHVAETAK